MNTSFEPNLGPKVSISVKTIGRKFYVFISIFCGIFLTNDIIIDLLGQVGSGLNMRFDEFYIDDRLLAPNQVNYSRRHVLGCDLECHSVITGTAPKLDCLAARGHDANRTPSDKLVFYLHGRC